MEATRFDAGTCSRKGRRKDYGFAESQCVGGVRFRGIYVDPVEARKGRGVEPGAVGEERVAAEIRDGGFQMQATGDGNGDDLVIVRGENGGELADTFGVAAFSEADEESSADAEDIATFESAGKRYIFERAKLAERLRERRGLTAAGLGSERQNKRQFIENNRGVFDEHGVRKLGFSGKRNHAGAQFAEQVLVGVVLLPRGSQIDGFAINKREFAMDDGWANGARDGGEHFSRESLHEND